MSNVVVRGICSRTAALLLCSAMGVTSGCHTAVKDPAAEEAIARATGIPDAVVFRTEGGPLDEPGGDEVLTIADAVRRAVTNDPGLQEALARVRIAAADAKQARLLPNPVLSLVLKFPEHGGKPSIEAELSGDLVSLLQRPRRTSAADNRLRSAAADAVTEALDVVSGVRERYLSVQALEEIMPVLAERRRLVAKLLELAQDRLAAGEGTRSDLTTLESQRVELEVEIAQKAQELMDERLQLARLIGRPSSAAAWKIDAWESPPGTPAPESAWVETGLAHRPEIRAAAWELAALGDEQALSRLAFLDGASFGVAAERDGDWTTGPSIAAPIPIFDFGQAQRARVTARQIEARHRLTGMRRQVVEDVRRAYRSLVATQENLERVRGQLIPLLQQRRDQAEEAYRAGLTDITPLFLAEQDLQASFARLVELQQASGLALLRLERAVGGAGVAGRVGPPVESPPGVPVGTPSSEQPAAPSR